MDKFKENKLKNIKNYERALENKDIKLSMIEDMIDDLKEFYELLESKTLLDKKTQKITKEEIRNIKSLRNQGKSILQIKKEVHWSTATISKVINGFYDNAKTNSNHSEMVLEEDRYKDKYKILKDYE